MIGPRLFGAWVAWRKPSADISILFATSSKKNTPDPIYQKSNDTKLAISPEIDFSIFARDLPGARVIVQDELGNLWVSQTSEGLVTRIEIKEGVAAGQEVGSVTWLAASLVAYSQL
jgi:hypothetical protein